MTVARINLVSNKHILDDLLIDRYNGGRADNIIDLVANGMGVSLLMRKPASHLAEGRVALVGIESPVVTYVKLYRLRGHRLSPEARRFFDYVAHRR